MKYYLVKKDLLAPHGLGDEPWRRTSAGMALTTAQEATLCMGFASVGEFEEKAGVRPLSLGEARSIINN